MKEAHKLHCFTCNENYDLLDLVKRDYNITDNKEAYKKICDIYNIQDISYIQDIPKGTKVIPLKPINEMQTQEQTPVKKNFDFTSAILNIEKKQTEEGLKHFKARGLTDEIIRKYHLCYADKFNEPMQEYKELAEEHKGYTNYKTGEVLDGYYLLPFMDAKDKMTYYTAEAVHRGEKAGDYEIPKYRKIKGLEAPIFNERYLSTSEDAIFITEGIFDALSIETAGAKAIALVGVAYNRFLRLIDELKPTSTFIIALDNDDAGKLNAEKICDELYKRNILYISYNEYISYIQDIPNISTCKDANEMLVKSRNDFAMLVDRVSTRAKELALEEYTKETAETYLSEFLQRVNTETYKPIPTQFSKLNKALGGGLLKQSIVCIGGRNEYRKNNFLLTAFR